MQSDSYFLEQALIQAKRAYLLGEVPVGAVLVSKNEIISTGYNTREIKNNPLGHAEIMSIQEASKKYEDWRLNETTLYVTVEPCLMCAGAIIQSRVSRVVYGCHDPKAGAVTSLYKVLSDKRLNHQVEITSGVLEKECQDLMQSFFKQLRRDVRVAEGARLESV